MKTGEEESRERRTSQRPGVHVSTLHMANGTQGSPCFWLPLQNAGVLEATTKQGPVMGTGLLGCTTFIFLCHIHRPFLYLLLHRPHSGREARAEVPAANLGLWSKHTHQSLADVCAEGGHLRKHVCTSGFGSKAKLTEIKAYFLVAQMRTLRTEIHPAQNILSVKLLFVFLHSHQTC